MTKEHVTIQYEFCGSLQTWEDEGLIRTYVKDGYVSVVGDKAETIFPLWRIISIQRTVIED